MIDEKKAIEIAKGCDPDIDNGEETENAYIFGNSKNMSFDDSPVVVLKADGSVMNMTAYLCECPRKTIREFKI